MIILIKILQKQSWEYRLMHKNQLIINIVNLLTSKFHFNFDFWQLNIDMIIIII